MGFAKLQLAAVSFINRTGCHIFFPRAGGLVECMCIYAHPDVFLCVCDCYHSLWVSIIGAGCVHVGVWVSEGWQRLRGNCPVKNWLPSVCVRVRVFVCVYPSTGGRANLCLHLSTSGCEPVIWPVETNPPPHLPPATEIQVALRLFYWYGSAGKDALSVMCSA